MTTPQILSYGSNAAINSFGRRARRRRRSGTLHSTWTTMPNSGIFAWSATSGTASSTWCPAASAPEVQQLAW
jgi:hypothetical protein